MYDNIVKIYPLRRYIPSELCQTFMSLVFVSGDKEPYIYRSFYSRPFKGMRVELFSLNWNNRTYFTASPISKRKYIKHF